MKGSMPAPRLPDVLFGKGDALEHFMGDYLVGMFDDAAPLVIEPVQGVRGAPVFEWRGMSIVLVQLPPGGELSRADAVDMIELDLMAPVDRTVGVHLVRQSPHVGAEAVRIPAGVVCTRRAGARGAAWLSFRGAAA